MEVFKDDILTLYKGDMREILQDLNFNYIITDPPYNINYKYPDFNDRMTESEYINLLNTMEAFKCVVIHYPESICNIVCEALGRVQKVIVWAYNNNASFKAHRSIAFFNCKPNFNKVKQPYKDPNDYRIKKLIEKGSKGARSYDVISDIQLIKNTSKEKVKGFTNQIPIKLLERIISLTTEPGDIICDPFFGTGSVYYACKNTGRKCVGIEISDHHINLFLERYKKNKD